MSNATRIYLIVNLIGISLILLNDFSIIHAIHSERRDSPDFGDSIKFLMVAVPVVLVCFVYSIVWAFKSVMKRNYQNLTALLFIAIVWGVLLIMLRMNQ